MPTMTSASVAMARGLECSACTASSARRRAATRSPAAIDRSDAVERSTAFAINDAVAETRSSAEACARSSPSRTARIHAAAVADRDPVPSSARV